MFPLRRERPFSSRLPRCWRRKFFLLASLLAYRANSQSPRLLLPSAITRMPIATLSGLVMPSRILQPVSSILLVLAADPIDGRPLFLVWSAPVRLLFLSSISFLTFPLLVSGESGNAALSEALRSSPQGASLDGLRIESPEFLARLESAVLGDLVVLHHTIFAVERQCTFLLSELSGIQGALSASGTKAGSPDGAASADPRRGASAPTPIILEPSCF